MEHDRPPLSPDDLDAMEYVATHTPDAFALLDADMICSFVRTYREYAPRLETTVKHIRDSLVWRTSLSYDCASSLKETPPGRDDFERMYQAGPVGRDRCGRAVILERIGRIPAKEFCQRFTADDVVQQSVYNREAAIAYSRKLSHEEGRLIQRITPLVDLKGFGWEHLSRDFLYRTRVLIQSLTSPYPDSTSGFFIINTPALFSIVWKAVRPMLDDETAAMVKVLGGPATYKPALAEMGVVIDDDTDLETVRLSWHETMRDVAPQGVKPPPFVYDSDVALLLTAANSAGIASPECLAKISAKSIGAGGLRAAAAARAHVSKRRSSGVARAMSSRLSPPSTAAPYQGIFGVTDRNDRADATPPSSSSRQHDGGSADGNSDAAARRASAHTCSSANTLLYAAGVGIALVALMSRAKA